MQTTPQAYLTRILSLLTGKPSCLSKSVIQIQKLNKKHHNKLIRLQHVHHGKQLHPYKKHTGTKNTQARASKQDSNRC